MYTNVYTNIYTNVYMYTSLSISVHCVQYYIKLSMNDTSTH